MNHDRAVRFVIGAGVFQFESLWQIVVELDRSKLPLAADAVSNHEVGLRPVERGFAFALGEVQARVHKNFSKCLFGSVPQLRRTDILIGTRVAFRKLHAVVVQADGVEYELDQVERVFEFFFNLLGSAEQVSVVLRQAADSKETIQLAGLLVSINRAEFSQPHGKVTVASLLRLIHLHVMRAVHRLEQVTLLTVLPAVQNLCFLVGRICVQRFAGAATAKQFGRATNLLLVFRAQIVVLQFLFPVVDKLPCGVPEDRSELRISIVREVAAGFVKFRSTDVW